MAFSGGLDSTVLLHLLAQLARSEALPALSALHVHHGLQAAADGWPAHCQVVCRSLGIPLRVERVQVAVGGSIEQAARDARYRAFQANLGEGQVLLTAQHLDDQAETLLFRLLRGAGLRGLAAMPASRPLGGGRLCRPLLGVSRAELEAYAQTHRLDWVEDPSNQDPRFSRNYLRREIMPRLASHWPQAVAGMARCAAHLREAEDLLAELAAIDLRACRQPSELDWPDWLDLPRIALEPLRRLSAARQRNLLRAWLGQLTRLPDSDHWAGWESLRDAGDDADPIWRLESGELRRGAGGSGGCRRTGGRRRDRSSGSVPLIHCFFPAMVGWRCSARFRRGRCASTTGGVGRCWPWPGAVAATSSDCSTKRAYRASCAVVCRCSSEPTNCSRWPTFLAWTVPARGLATVLEPADERPGFELVSRFQ